MIRMKSSKGMIAIAKATAISYGIRSAYNQGKICGFGLRIEELNKIYAMEGFPVYKPNYSVVNDHIATWKVAGLVAQAGDMIFFLLDRRSFSDYQANMTIQEYAKDHDGQFSQIYGFMEDII